MDAAVGCEVNFVFALHLLACVYDSVCMLSVFVSFCTRLLPIQTHTAPCVAPVDDFIFWPNIKFVIRSLGLGHKTFDGQCVGNMLLLNFKSIFSTGIPRRMYTLLRCPTACYAKRSQSISKLSQAVRGCYAATRTDGTLLLAGNYKHVLIGKGKKRRKCDMLCAMTGKYFTCTTNRKQEE